MQDILSESPNQPRVLLLQAVEAGVGDEADSRPILRVLGLVMVDPGVETSLRYVQLFW